MCPWGVFENPTGGGVGIKSEETSTAPTVIQLSNPFAKVMSQKLCPLRLLGRTVDVLTANNLFG
jgi:hypothetical protein